MHSELPPSSADKWIHCHGWLNQTRPFRQGESTSSEAAEEGTLAHLFLEALLLEHLGKPFPEGRPQVPKEMEERITAIFEWVIDQPGDLYAEERYDYGEQFGFVDLFGTADVTLVEEDCITIADLKYGFGLVEVEGNFQLMIYLAGAVARFGPRERYRLVILQPRGSHRDGSTRVWEVDHETLTDFLVILEDAITKNYKGGTPVAGDHCRHYCPALGSCPGPAEQAIRLFREHAIE